jgi:DNA recombination protein RmuC
MAIAQRSSEVWNILSAVRSEFKKYNETVGKVARQLKTATGSVEELDRRTRAMDRALKRVETLPEDGSAAKLLGLDGMTDSEFEDGGDPLPLTVPLAAAE